ncbi:MAG: 3-phosphoshikimate 1-carboxyvinyltransferase [Deltaproteobacteria bacterium GWC2_56_8]|nr:MAG: 3-phosphoshikimate 1-carboxyvinyltransferase [Deltaproteobacteria bacterium GWB2_55_19]OGP33034.1 MAG: 3-phosphoshikimate 1-carboxyvinyltransferase [Deltaproteobacteria bacterium GWC2_56_8]HAO93533.1 3-phosphoshikimate 1-carboxyvinyltransferase [Deltaproteobacteria bacterium]
MTTFKKDIFGGAIIAVPGRGLKGEMTVPGDKSISHRAVMLGSIASGITEVTGFLEGEDNLSTIGAFRAMGIGIDLQKDSRRVVIRGNGMRGLTEPADVIDAGNSGTTTRLITGLLSAQPFFSVITGDASLRKRPMKRVVEPLSLMGASISGRNNGNNLPLAISGRKLKGITCKTPIASAQLKSALMLAGIYAEGETVIEEPEKSRDHTERMLCLFGADVRTDKNSVSVRSTNELIGCKIEVPGDISSAAFFVVGAMISPASALLIRGVGVNLTRTGIIDVLRKMGGTVEVQNERVASGEPVADLLVKTSRLKGTEVSGAELLPAIDEFPIICVAAAFSEGTTRITGARELRVKESDRIAAMSEALSRVGVRNAELPDGIVIEGVGSASIKGGKIESHGDHRIAMSLAMAALRSDEGVEIDGASSVDVSFPGFFDQLKRVRVS